MQQGHNLPGLIKLRDIALIGMLECWNIGIMGFEMMR